MATSRSTVRFGKKTTSDMDCNQNEVNSYQEAQGLN